MDEALGYNNNPTFNDAFVFTSIALDTFTTYTPLMLGKYRFILKFI